MMEGLRKAIDELCPHIPALVRQDFFLQMDPEYFLLYSPQEIATHLKMSYRLSPDHPIECRVVPQKNSTFIIEVVAFDYFSEFSLLCGLITSFGLNIQSGHIYTFAETRTLRGITEEMRLNQRSRKKIVDLFHVRLLRGEVFDEARQGEFEKELQALIFLLAQDKILEAREWVNRWVVEYLSRTQRTFMGRLYPVQIKFNSRLSEKWTVMEIHSKDTPAFLYSLANALSLRGIYINKVRIEKKGVDVWDQIYLCDRQGRKIEGQREQGLLKIAIVMIKRFTHFLAWSPDPARAIRYFDQLMDRLMEIGLEPSVLSFVGRRQTLNLLARLFGTSEFLWEDLFRIQFKNLLPILRGFRKVRLLRNRLQMRRQLKRLLSHKQTLEGKRKILNKYKDRELFRIDMKHLLGSPNDLVVFSQAVTDLADVILEEAYDICDRYLKRQYCRPLLRDRTACPFAICGLGKFGGREMGYASDIELLFIYGSAGGTQDQSTLGNGDYFERLAQGIVNFIEARREGIFQIDVRLRPHGNAGSLANSMEQFRAYYSPTGEAAPFERQALTKLRWVAGDELLGQLVESHRDQFVYSGQPWDLGLALHLRHRQMKELVKPGEVNIKYSPGGVIDIEYAVQYLQMMYGRDYAVLRCTSTLKALHGLYLVKILSKREYDDLRKAYLFLRVLIDALRMVRGNARDLVLPDRTSQEFRFLARRLGYMSGDWEKDAQKLDQEIRYHMQKAHHFFTSRFEKI